MIKNEVAGKYGQAFFELALEKNSLQKFNEELNSVRDFILEHEDFSEVFFHQRISSGEKKKLVKRFFEEHITQEVLNFLFLIIDNNREFFIKDIINDFNKRVNKEEDILEVKVISAVELSEKLTEKLLKKLEKVFNYEIILETEVKPEIIGGIILQAGDYLIDGSLKNGLQSIQKSIEKIPVSELGVG